MPNVRPWQETWDASPAAAVLRREPSVGTVTMNDMAKQLIGEMMEAQRLRLINAPAIRRLHRDDIGGCLAAMMDAAQDIRKQSARLGRAAEKVQLDVLKVEAINKEIK